MVTESGHIAEIAVRSSVTYCDPLRDIEVTCDIQGPGSASRKVRAFWDGGDTWRVRVAAGQPGTWKYRFSCSDPTNGSIDSASGTFEVTAGSGDNPFRTHGRLRISDDRYRLVYNDGTPFFWMADTAWNGVLKASEDDWRTYLEVRRDQGFTAVQCVLTQWRAFNHDRHGDTAFSRDSHLSVNPAFFQRLDNKVALINAHGLVAALVVIWSCSPADPGNVLPEEDLEVLGKYIVDRYNAWNVVWFLGGDGKYQGEKADKWKRLAAKLFGRQKTNLVTMHPCGMAWVEQEFRDQTWYDFIGYQSGHGDSDDHVRWLVAGPAAQQWNQIPARPVIDLEPRYEAHSSYQGRRPFDARDVRNGLYWNLLNVPTAGVTYGHHGVWPWCEQREIPMGHPNTGEAPPWYEAIRSEGSASVKVLRAFFDDIGWSDLFPAGELVANQPGIDDPREFVAAARKKDGSAAIVYLPKGGVVHLDMSQQVLRGVARWFDVRNGQYSGPLNIDATGTITAPDSRDWLLVVKK